MKLWPKSLWKRIVIVVVAVWLVLWAAVAIPYWFVALPQPGEIGPKFKYVGKYVSYCVLVCDQQTWQEYYYVTDMTQKQVAGYFKNLEYLSGDNPGGGGWNGRYESKELTFKDTKDKFHSLLYYDTENGKIVAQEFGINVKHVNGHSLIGIRDTEFQAFKDAIK